MSLIDHDSTLLILPRALLNAIITLLSELPDWEEELSLTAIYEVEARHFKTVGIVAVDDFYRENLQTTLRKLKREERGRYEELLERWPKMEEWVGLVWERREDLEGEI